MSRIPRSNPPLRSWFFRRMAAWGSYSPSSRAWLQRSWGSAASEVLAERYEKSFLPKERRRRQSSPLKSKVAPLIETLLETHKAQPYLYKIDRAFKTYDNRYLKEARAPEGGNQDPVDFINECQTDLNVIEERLLEYLFPPARSTTSGNTTPGIAGRRRAPKREYLLSAESASKIANVYNRLGEFDDELGDGDKIDVDDKGVELNRQEETISGVEKGASEPTMAASKPRIRKAAIWRRETMDARLAAVPKSEWTYSDWLGAMPLPYMYLARNKMKLIYLHQKPPHFNIPKHYLTYTYGSRFRNPTIFDRTHLYLAAFLAVCKTYKSYIIARELSLDHGLSQRLFGEFAKVASGSNKYRPGVMESTWRTMIGAGPHWLEE